MKAVGKNIIVKILPTSTDGLIYTHKDARIKCQVMSVGQGSHCGLEIGQEVFADSNRGSMIEHGDDKLLVLHEQYVNIKK